MKNILITLGCSFTQGDGCWDLDALNHPYFKGKTWDELDFTQKSTLFDLNKERFLRYSWPSQLQEMLGYDELYNLGFGGASISHSVKMFMEDIYYRDKDFNGCNVLVIQLLSFPDRISFYTDGSLTTMPSGHPVHDSLVEFMDVQLDGNSEGIDGNRDDTTLEAYFYMKVMKGLCENKGWNFLFTGARGDESLHMKTYKDNLRIQSSYMPFVNFLNYTNEYKSFEGHPNEKWYKIMAEKMYNWIVENKKEIPMGTATEFIKERVLPKNYRK